MTDGLRSHQAQATGLPPKTWCHNLIYLRTPDQTSFPKADAKFEPRAIPSYIEASKPTIRPSPHLHLWRVEEKTQERRKKGSHGPTTAPARTHSRRRHRRAQRSRSPPSPRARRRGEPHRPRPATAPPPSVAVHLPVHAPSWQSTVLSVSDKLPPPRSLRSRDCTPRRATRSTARPTARWPSSTWASTRVRSGVLRVEGYVGFASRVLFLWALVIQMVRSTPRSTTDVLKPPLDSSALWTAIASSRP